MTAYALPSTGLSRLHGFELRIITDLTASVAECRYSIRNRLTFLGACSSNDGNLGTSSTAMEAEADRCAYPAPGDGAVADSVAGWT